MLKLPSVTDLDVQDKKVILRLDLDVKDNDFEDLRIKAASETLDYLKNKAGEIIIIGHKGRPGGKVDESLSTKPFQEYFSKWGAKVEENLRFDKGEEENDSEFVKEIASLGEVYINEAFASSHREHASIVGLPKVIPSGFGMHFIKEVENLSKIFEPDRPLVILISGIKEDKIKMIEPLSNLADKVLVGGRLPDYLGDKGLVSIRLQAEGEKVLIGNLIMDKEDITLNTIDRFTQEVLKAKTILLAGVLGRYEDEGHRQGTEKVFKAVANSTAFKIAGGGDTIDAINLYGLEKKFNWISVGGGATLQFLINKTLPGIDALK